MCVPEMRFVKGDYRTTSSVTQMLQELGWQDLQRRRRDKAPPPMHAILHEEDCELFVRIRINTFLSPSTPVAVTCVCSCLTSPHYEHLYFARVTIGWAWSIWECRFCGTARDHIPANHSQPSDCHMTICKCRLIKIVQYIAV